jgi:hypothetical protein
MAYSALRLPFAFLARILGDRLGIVTDLVTKIKQAVSVWACGPSGSLSEFDAGAAA